MSVLIKTEGHSESRDMSLRADLLGASCKQLHCPRSLAFSPFFTLFESHGAVFLQFEIMIATSDGGDRVQPNFYSTAGHEVVISRRPDLLSTCQRVC